jgi:hypothetical protein
MQEVGFHEELYVVQPLHLNAENFKWKIARC